MALKVSVFEALPKARRALGVLESRGRVCEVPWRRLPDAGAVEWHAAVDGGSRIISLHDEDVFIVKGWSGWWPPAGESYYASVGPVVPAPEAEYRVPVYREIVEYRVALEAAREARPGGVLLFDGSASTAVKWWRHSQGREQKRLREALPRLEREAGVSRDEFERQVLGGSELPFSYNVAVELAARGGDGGGSLDWIPGLEMLEKLLLFKAAVEEAWRNGALTVFLAKTVRRSKYCGGPRSDIYYLERSLPREAGMVEPSPATSIAVGAPRITGIREGEDLHLFREVFPLEYGIRNFYLERVAVVESYVRLENGGPILLVGVLYDDKAETRPISLLERAVSLLAGLSLNRDGYPIPLQIAHKRAAVRPEEEVAVAKIIEDRRAGRAMLRL